MIDAETQERKKKKLANLKPVWPTEMHKGDAKLEHKVRVKWGVEILQEKLVSKCSFFLKFESV